MHWNPLSGAKLEDVFGPFDKNIRRNRRQARDAKRTKVDFKIEALESREVPAIDASIAATSLASTAGNNAAIGEIVRVRAAVPLAQDGGTFDPATYNVTASLASGLTYIDGTATIALVSNGGITSTLGTGANVLGSSANGVKPTFGITPVVSNGQLIFNTGISSIADRDANGEFAVIEFNALVNNVLTSQSGTALNAGFSLSVGSSTGIDTGSVGVTVVEASVTDLVKTVSQATAAPGDTLRYTLTFSNAAGAATAYNLAVLDNVPNGLQLDPSSVNVVGGTGVVNKSTPNSVAIEIDSLAPGAGVTITYSALVTAAAGVALTADAQVQYTSLPGTNGEDPNPTGSVTPGRQASATGERRGCGCGPTGLNDYRDDATSTVTIANRPTLQTSNTNVITGRVFGDTDHSGGLSTGDAMLAGIRMALYGVSGNFIASTFTDANGVYTFDNLPDGVYGVQEQVQPAGYQDGLDFVGTAGGQTGPNGGIGTDYIEDITVSGGVTATGYDFGECPCQPNTAQLSGYVYVDNNDNCSYDTGDVPIPNVTLMLTGTTATGQTITRTTQTDSNGYYEFSALPTGTYTVAETQPGSLNGNVLTDGCDSPGSTGGTVGPNHGRGTDTISGIAIVSGDNSVNNNFGELCPNPPAGTVRVYGSLKCDVNCDQIHTPDEPGIPNVTINLYDANGTFVTSTVTNVDGYFEFNGLAPGKYRIAYDSNDADLPTGFADGYDVAAPGGNVGPNKGVGTNWIDTATLAAGDASGLNCFFICCQGSATKTFLSGHVYFDANCNCTFDTGDQPISGVTLRLKNSAGQIVATTTTDANGFYIFADLDPGNYTVEEVQPATNNAGQPVVDGCETPGTGGGSVAVNDVISGIALGLTGAENNNFYECPTPTPPPGSLSGHVYFDANCNCTLDTGDQPISGVTVRLRNSAGQVVSTTTTDSNGFYQFTGLTAGNYTVEEVQPATFNGQTLVDGCEKAGTGGGSVAVNDIISGIAVIANGTAQNNDFYECPTPPSNPGTLSGHVYFDANCNCVFDTGDQPMAGVTITLRNAAGAVVGTTTTDASGFYQFTNLAAGNYTVAESQPATFNGQTLVDGCEKAGTGGGSVAVNDTISGIAIVAGSSAINNDFYECPTPPNPGTLSGHVYFDANCNCVFDTGDQPMAGVTVRLKNAAGQVIATTTTNAQGLYQFTNLTAGNYTVEEVQPTTFNGQTLVDGCEKAGTGGGSVAVNDTISGIAIVAGSSAINNDFYECPTPPNPGTLSGHVYFDANCNCVFDTGDQPMAGVTITLRNAAGAVVGTTTTDASGFYQFTNLAAGNYTVAETQPTTFNGQTLVDGCEKAGTGGGSVAVNDTISGIAIVAGSSAINNDFYECPTPNQTPGNVSGFVFCYTGSNSTVRTILSTALSGITVTLTGTTATGTTITRTTTTSALGFYSFTDVPAGTYSVSEIQPATNILGNDTILTDGLASIEIVGGTNSVTPQRNIHPGILVAGQSSQQTYYNFGEVCQGTSPVGSALSGYVYFDANRNCAFDRVNGVPTNGDLPIQGVTVTLTGTTVTGKTVNITTQTNDIGFYLFDKLEAGTYTVTETQPAAFIDYCENPGTTGGTVGPNNGIGGSNFINTINLPANTISEQNNFGEISDTPVNPNPGPNPLPNPTNKGQLLSSTGTVVTGTTSGSTLGTAAQSPTFANAASRTGLGNPTATRYLVTGTDQGGAPLVRVFDFTTGVEKFSFLAYDASFTGGVRVASNDVTGDGVADIITAAGVGGGPHVKVFDGVTGQLVRQFFAYDSSFTGGVYLAAADVNGDGVAEIITGAGEGGAGHVKVFNTVGQFAEFFAYDLSFRGGVRVAAADFTGDGRADIATGAGVGGGPHVCVFDLNQPAAGGGFTIVRNVMAFDPAFRGGIYVAANDYGTGDATGDGRADLVVGAGAGGGAYVKVLNGVDFSTVTQFLAYTDFTGGVRVGLLDMNGDGRNDVIVGTGPGKGAFVRVVDLVSAKDLEFFQAYNPAYLGGVVVTGA
ncbi:MAG: SdrD B-like domain-containing protein [Gemmataceae bacterium]